MGWNPWIRIEPDEPEGEEARRLYDRTRTATGRPPDTVRLTSRTPRVAGLLHDLQRAVDDAARGLSAREREIAALVVSVLNGCVH
jgi:alkylhydroperoxidase family enzyme